MLPKLTPLCKIEISEIEKDVDRTFPEHVYFDKDYYGYIGQFSLSRVLCRFSANNPEIGYCQGVNFIAGFLLMVSGGHEIETYCMLEAVIHRFQIKNFYSEEMLGIKYKRC